jgi:hypothetical protein
MDKRFKVGDIVRHIGTDVIFTIEEIKEGGLNGFCGVWGEGLNTPWYNDGLGRPVKNWHNPSPGFMELVEPLTITYTMSKHRLV